MAMKLEINFKEWLITKLESNQEDDSFITYIISMLNDDETNENEKKESLLALLQELNPDKTENETTEVVNEILTKYKSTESSSIQSEIKGIEHQENEDPIEKILEMTQKHKNQVVDVKKAQNNEEKKNANYVYYSQLTKGDDESSENEGSLDLEANTNAQSVLEKEKKKREQLHENYLKQQERIKKDQQQQREREEERKKKAKQKTAKVERKR